ncbi:MAG TPA: hypothetical protein VH763_16915 [Gemmatimonadales bacterium]
MHPDTDQGYIAAAGKLKQMVERFRIVAALQRAGLIDVHTASEKKDALSREMRSGPIAHMAQVGRETAARSMAAEAERRRDVLVKYGLAESVLEQFTQLLDQFEAAMALGEIGRVTHVSATRELRALGSEMARTVRILDARHRLRFKDDPELLGAWISASTVRGRPRGDAGAESIPEGATPPAGDVRPAA